MNNSFKIVIIGAGSAGIATAYYLTQKYGVNNVLLIDKAEAMSFTSAHSGENYRNWWPHPSMTKLTNHSIDLMEGIALQSNNRINMSRLGYSLATRTKDIDSILEQLKSQFINTSENLLRFHQNSTSNSYHPTSNYAHSNNNTKWQTAGTGVDILQNPKLIRQSFPTYDRSVQSIIHIRRGGDFSSQQLAMFMLDHYRSNGGERLTGMIESITKTNSYRLEVSVGDDTTIINADKIINAAGPFANNIANMLDIELPITNSFQQKIAFEDTAKAINRDMPFSIDLDSIHLDWSTEDKQILLSDPEFSWLANEMPGAIHCRPDGGINGSWLKLGWAYNQTTTAVTWEPPLDPQYPEIVLRAAARLNPRLKAYYGKLPRNMHHYGGWYTMTAENWPLIGPMNHQGAFMNCALSGFGSMAACAAGELCAAWVTNNELPEYAADFSLQRYANKPLMDLLLASNKGVL